MCRAYGAREITRMWTQGLRPGLNCVAPPSLELLTDGHKQDS